MTTELSRSSDLSEAILLAAGSGSRLWPLTESCPKPLLTVGNRTALELNLTALTRAGIRRCFINTYTHAGLVEEFIARGSWDLHAITRQEIGLTGPAGGAAFFVRDLTENAVVVVSADAVHSIDLRSLVAFHRKRHSVLTVALREVPDGSRFGVPTVAHDDRIIGFVEKPEQVTSGPALVSCGIYCVETDLLRQVDRSVSTDFGKDLLPSLSTRGEAVFGFKTSDYWRDIGEPTSLLRANLDAALGIFDSRPKGRELSRLQWAEDGVEVAPTAELRGPLIIGRNVQIGRHSIICGPVVIGDDVTIGPHCRVMSSLILPGASIPQNSSVVGGILGKRSSSPCG